MQSSEQNKDLPSKQSSQEQDKFMDESLKELTSVFPDEIAEDIRKLPPRVRESLTMLSISGRVSPGSELTKRITSEHIDKLIDSNEKENEREYQKFKSSEITKRWTMGAILGLILMVLVYSGLTKDKQLSEKIITAGISALGGFGVGYAVAKKNN